MDNAAAITGQPAQQYGAAIEDTAPVFIDGVDVPRRLIDDPALFKHHVFQYL